MSDACEGVSILKVSYELIILFIVVGRSNHIVGIILCLKYFFQVVPCRDVYLLLISCSWSDTFVLLLCTNASVLFGGLCNIYSNVV